VIISSVQNPRVKQIRALASRKERDQTGLLFVDGLHLVLEAVQTGAPIEYLVVAPELIRSPRARDLVDWARDAGRPIFAVSADVFQDLGSRGFVQGIGAVVRQRWTALPALRRPQRLGVVGLAGTQYPGNLGTILRTADAVGADGVVLLEATSDPHDPVAVRASAGAIFSMPLTRASFAKFVTWAREQDLSIVGTSPVSQLDYRSVSYPSPFVLLMGSEGRGLAPEQLAACDRVVSIRMAGRCDSLNLAVATSVILYEAFAQRRQGEKPLGERPEA
jgi:TrmH family RNA methyltransferase